MSAALAAIDLALTEFADAWSGDLDLAAQPDWLTRPVADHPRERPLWVNRAAFMAGATGVLEIGARAGINAVAALAIVPDVRFCGIESPSYPFAAAVGHRLTRMHSGRAEIRLGDIGRVLALMHRNDAVPFDRVLIGGAESAVACRAYLLEALRLCRADGLIMIERCDLAHVNEAVVALLAGGMLRCASLAGWRHIPEQIVLRATPAAAVPRADEARIILVAIFGDVVQREWALSRPSVAAYAERVGATLVEVGGELPDTQRPLAKMVALDRLERPGRVLLLDTDIVIRAHAPDLFDIVPPDAAALFIEGQVADRAEILRQTLTCYETTARKPFYGNTGVFMLPQDLVRRFSLSAVRGTLYIDEMYEQGYFNALLHQLGYPVFNLSPLFNCMPAVTPDWLGEAFLVHFAGGSLGVHQTHLWNQTRDPGSGVTVRSRSGVNPKRLRDFDIRNEMRLRSGAFDRLFPSTHLVSSRGMLIAQQGCCVLRCPAAHDLLVYGPYVELPPGSYRLDILLSRSAFCSAYLEGSDLDPTLFGPGPVAEAGAPASLICDVAKNGTGDLLVPLAAVRVDDGRVRLSFTTHDTARSVECHIFGGGEPFDIYGLRIWRVTEQI